MQVSRAKRYGSARSNLPTGYEARLNMAAPEVEAIKTAAREPNACMVTLRDMLYKLCDEYDLCKFDILRNKRVGTQMHIYKLRIC